MLVLYLQMYSLDTLLDITLFRMLRIQPPFSSQALFCYVLPSVFPVDFFVTLILNQRHDIERCKPHLIWPFIFHNLMCDERPDWRINFHRSLLSDTLRKQKLHLNTLYRKQQTNFVPTFNCKRSKQPKTIFSHFKLMLSFQGLMIQIFKDVCLFCWLLILSLLYIESKKMRRLPYRRNKY